MINVRFHVVSLVAVFLALGIGVAMGASFIDRATVDSMRGRVDDLESGFRERGDELQRYGDFLRDTDEAAETLTEPASRAAEGSLDGTPVVLVAPAGLPDGSAALMGEVLANASADVVGRIELQDGIADAAVSGSGGQDDEGGTGSDASGDSGSGGGSEDGTEATTHLELATALATLSAEPGEAATESPGTGEVDPTTGEPAATDPIAEASAVIDDYSERGLLSIDPAGQPPETAFPATSGVRYVVVMAPDTSPPSADWVVPFVEEYGALSTATMLVAGVDSPRAAGELPEQPADGESGATAQLPELMEPIRTGAASNEVSSVQFAGEPLARLSVVYGVQALLEGIVGHFGLGDGVDTPYPTVAQE